MGLIDLNAPRARGKEAIETLSAGAATINGLNPTLNCVVVRMADVAQESSLRGLHDEEISLVDSMAAVKQHCDSRFVELFTCKSKQSRLKKVGYGRIAVQFDEIAKNMWLSGSELIKEGRPLEDGSDDQVPTALLPLQSELLTPVSASPDRDITTSDRKRPCVEAARAQKGTHRDKICLTSLYRGVELRGPSVLCNLTGNVEDAGVAVTHLVSIRH